MTNKQKIPSYSVQTIIAQAAQGTFSKSRMKEMMSNLSLLELMSGMNAHTVGINRT